MMYEKTSCWCLFLHSLLYIQCTVQYISTISTYYSIVYSSVYVHSPVECASQGTAECTVQCTVSVWYTSQCIVYSPVYTHCPVQCTPQRTVQCTLTVWYSVHPSVQSSVQVYIYAQSTVQSAFQCTAEVQLEYIWSTSSIQSSAHLDAYGVPSRGPSQGTQCGVKSVHVQCTCQCLMNSPVYTSVRLVYIHIQPGVQCTLQCTVCTCLFHIHKIL